MSTRRVNALGVTQRRSVRGKRTDLARLASRAGAGPLDGVAILGRAALHAWRLGDMTDEEAGDFIDDVSAHLIAELASVDR